MNQQPDKLFRDKLRAYQKPASPQAWKRISGNLHKKNRGFLWLKVAAGILLLATAGILIYPVLTPTRVAVIRKETKPANEKRPVIETPDERTNNNANENTGDITPSPSAPPRNNEEATASRLPKKKATPNVQVADERTAEKRERVAPSNTEDEVKSAASTLQTQDNPLPETPVAKAEGSASNITIVFTAEEVNEKYLSKKITAKATPQEKESSTLKKVLEKANDLKHNQDPLGDLRQKKNEILAFNFRNDKQRDENK